MTKTSREKSKRRAKGILLDNLRRGGGEESHRMARLPAVGEMESKKKLYVLCGES